MSDLENRIASATPAELIIMLYERAIRDIENGLPLMVIEGDPTSMSQAVHNLVHAQQIILELKHSLNMEKGGNLALNMDRIYEYVNYRLLEAITNRKPEPASECVSLLKELMESWKSMSRSQSSGLHF